MSSKTTQVPYLRTSRDFPQDSLQLSEELNKMYLDVANTVNNRTIGIFPTTQPAVTGETWFLGGATSKRQGQRRVYPFTSSSLTIAHGITTSQISGFTAIYGTFVDGSGSWYPLPYIDVTAVGNQVNLIVNATNIVITLGAGSPPSLANGFVVLEWLANP
jgi:hypothetical protein